MYKANPLFLACLNHFPKEIIKKIGNRFKEYILNPYYSDNFCSIHTIAIHLSEFLFCKKNHIKNFRAHLELTAKKQFSVKCKKKIMKKYEYHFNILKRRVENIIHFPFCKVHLLPLMQSTCCSF